MNTRNLWIWLFALFTFATLATPASAVTVFCASNSQELQLDLSLAVQNKGDNVIKLVRSATPYTVNDASYVSLSGGLSVLGGYASGCGSRIVNPANTIIDFSGGVVLFETFFAPSDSLLQFDGLTLQHGNRIIFSTGSYNCCTPDNAGNVRVSNARITDFHSTDNNGEPTPFFQDVATVSFDNTSGQITLLNLQIDHITQSGSSACAVAVSFEGNTTGNLGYLSVDLSNGKAFCFETAELEQESGNFQFNVYNSIFWASDNSAAPIRGRTTSSPIHVNLVNDIFHAYLGDGDVTFSAPSAPAPTDPLWVDPANGNYHLAPSTASAVNAAINSGTNSVPNGNPVYDIEGSARQFGSHPDRGAYESPYSDAAAFTVTNAGDCGTAGCGSLRGAIIAANNSSAGSASIKFAIPVACPAVINLGSPLPDITKAMSIDGYSQMGSAANTDSAAFNATLCVVVQPLNVANSYYAVRVPAAADSNVSLYLAGIGFGQFPAGVELLGGANHQIVGNQFGGLINNNTFQLYGSTTAAIFLDVPSGQATIGGGAAASRNAFQNVFSYTAYPASAIQVGFHVNSVGNACQIVGNTIGVADDGTFNSRNIDYGIYVQGNGCLIDANRIVGVKKDAIFLDSVAGGGNANVVRNNVLGLIPYGFDQSSSNLGAGIRISGSKNVIGQGPITGNGVASNLNLIAHMDGGGVVVVDNNSYGNTIRGNSILNNGVDGDGMSIDLRDDGRTANDISDSDIGPNDAQNYPVAHSLKWSVPPHPQDIDLAASISGTLRTFVGPGFYQIDAYYAQGCTASGQGIAERWIGSVDYVYIPVQGFTAAFTVPVSVPYYDPSHGAIGLTATNNSNAEGSTSEVSICLPVDTIFRDDVEGL